MRRGLLYDAQASAQGRTCSFTKGKVRLAVLTPRIHFRLTSVSLEGEAARSSLPLPSFSFASLYTTTTNSSSCSSLSFAFFPHLIIP